MTLGANQIGAYAADLLDLESQIETLQTGKRDLYAAIREEHGRVQADAIKNAIRISRMDDEKRERIDATDAETERVLAIISRSAGAPPARAITVPDEKPAVAADTGDSDAGAIAVSGAIPEPVPPSPGADAANGDEGTNPAFVADTIPSESIQGKTDTASTETEATPDGDVIRSSGGDDTPATHRVMSMTPLEPRQAGNLKGFGFTVSFEDQPAPTAADNARKLRPYCLHADDLHRCAGQGRKHCFECQQAHADKIGEAA